MRIFDADLRRITSNIHISEYRFRKFSGACGQNVAQKMVAIRMGKFSPPRPQRAISAEVSSDVFDTSSLTPSMWNEIWTLTAAFFDTDRAYAESKLKEHQLIALFRSKNDGRLIGMASMDVYPVSFQGRSLAIIYTVHVLLYEEYRGHNLIQGLGVRMFLKTRFKYPLRSIYWFFDTYSYKGYLLLPRNFQTYWPHPDQKMPERERALRDHLAQRTYGPAWRSEKGIVLRSEQKRMKPDVDRLNLNIPVTPEMKYFSQANPGHGEGDMLVCLCPLTITNWISVGIRALQRRWRRRQRKVA